MALKRKIDKAAFDKLPEALQVEYVEKDGSYELDVDGGEDTGALRRAKDREVQARKDATKRAEEAEARLAELDTSDARKRGDIEALEKSWKDKLDAEVAGRRSDNERSQGFISKALVDGVADKIAAEISTSPALIRPHIKARLTADLTGDEPITKVLGVDGKPSALTVADLKKEFVDNADFKAIIVASKATGGGASPKGTKTTPGSAHNPDNPKPLAAMSAQEMADHLTAKKADEQD